MPLGVGVFGGEALGAQLTDSKVWPPITIEHTSGANRRTIGRLHGRRKFDALWVFLEQFDLMRREEDMRLVGNDFQRTRRRVEPLLQVMELQGNNCANGAAGLFVRGKRHQIVEHNIINGLGDLSVVAL